MTPEQLLSHADTGRLWPAQPPSCFQDLPAAYRAALAVRALRISRGEKPRGFKIGFTNRTIWSRYEVFAPIWGSVWDSTLITSDAGDDGDTIVSLKHLCQPRIEPETVFGFKSSPPAAASLDDLFDSLDWMAPGFEIVQSHRADWKFRAPDTVADGGLHGRLLVGRRLPIRSVARDAAQLHTLLAHAQVVLERNGTVVERGHGANVLDSPLHALRHFVDEQRACPGAPDLQAGDVVTTGTWTDAWPVQSGEPWTARFDAPMGDLSVRFE
jgi:2-oxo-3-hexenedioate decarboxylase